MSLLRGSAHGIFGVLAVAFFLAPATTSAQVELGEGVELALNGRVHAQFASSSHDDGSVADLFIRRARIKAHITVNDFVDGRIQTDFAGGEASLKDVYARLSFTPGFRVSFGQFKRAFDVFELASSTELELVERDGRIDGLDACGGVGRLCSLSRFTESLEYSDRDMGVRIEGSAREGRFGYLLTVTNGTGANAADENDAKSVSGRVEFDVGDRVRIGGNVGVHDYVSPGPEADDDFAVALGGDIEVGSYRDGLHLTAGFVGGDNWKLLDASHDPTTFLTGQVLASYYVPLEGERRLAGVEPVGRISWGDPDSDVDDDGGLLFTPGLFLYFDGRNRFGLNLDVYAPQDGDTEASLKTMMFFYF